MAMANMNLIGVFVTKLWPVQALACGGDGGGDGGDGGATKNIISPKFSNFGDIIISWFPRQMLCFPTQIKVGTLCVKDNQVLKLEHRLGLILNTKKT